MVKAKTEIQVEDGCPVCGSGDVNFTMDYPDETSFNVDERARTKYVVDCHHCETTLTTTSFETPDFRIEKETEMVERTIRTQYVNLGTLFNGS